MKQINNKIYRKLMELNYNTKKPLMGDKRSTIDAKHLIFLRWIQVSNRNYYAECFVYWGFDSRQCWVYSCMFLCFWFSSMSPYSAICALLASFAIPIQYFAIVHFYINVYNIFVSIRLFLVSWTIKRNICLQDSQVYQLNQRYFSPTISFTVTFLWKW